MHLRILTLWRCSGCGDKQLYRLEFRVIRFRIHQCHLISNRHMDFWRNFQSGDAYPAGLAIKLYFMNYCDSFVDQIVFHRSNYFSEVSCFGRKESSSSFDLHHLLCWPWGYKKFSCSAQLNVKFFLLINVKMPTIVGISTFMSRKNISIGLSKPVKSWISWYFYNEHLKFHAQLSWAWKIGTIASMTTSYAFAITEQTATISVKAKNAYDVIWITFEMIKYFLYQHNLYPAWKRRAA